jgi:hypothetical protein
MKMAIILKTNNHEEGYYQKIILDRCYINMNGLYIGTIVFKNKDERDKDKLRQKDLVKFIDNYNFKLEEIENLEDGPLKLEQVLLFDKVKIAANNLIGNMYVGLKNQDERITIKEEYLIEAEKYGFKREWYENPIVLVKEDEIRVSDYNKQDFNLESFYQSLKENIYTDKDGNLLVEDDL